MTFTVIKGFKSSLDDSGKQRFAVVLFREQGWVHIAPCTTYPERNDNRVPHEHVLITKDSPAYRRTGFTAGSVAISLRDVAAYPPDSVYLEDAVPVGELNLDRDARLKLNWNTVVESIKNRLIRAERNQR